MANQHLTVFQRIFAIHTMDRQAWKRRSILVIAGFAVCVYALGVLWYAYSIPDIGLHCAFDTEILRIDPEFAAPGYDSRLPVHNDRITRLGDVPIHTWSDVVNSLASLHRENQDVVRVEFLHDGVKQVCWRIVGKPPALAFVHSILWFLLKFSLFLLVSVAYWKRTDDVALRRFLFLCVVTIGAFMGGYHWLRIASSPPLVTIFMVCAIALPVVSLHFYLVFPRPKSFVLRWPRWTLLGLYGVSVALLVVMLSTYASVVWTYRTGHPPETVIRLSRALLLEIYVALVVAGLQFLCCVASLAHSYATTLPGSLARNQVKWILSGALLATIPVGYTLYLAVTDVDRFGVGGAAWPMFTASVCFTLAYGISISRYGLLEVTQVLNWGIATIAVSVIAGLAYTALVFIGTFLIGSRIEHQSPLRQAIWVSMTAWLLLLALDFFRWRWRKIVDKQLHRERHQLDRTLRQMSQAVEQLVDVPTLCRRFLHVVTELLNVPSGMVYLREGDAGFTPVATIGAVEAGADLAADSPLVVALEQSPFVQTRTSGSRPLEPAQLQLRALRAEVALPLRYERSLMAVLFLGPRTTGEYGVEELHTLTTIGHVLAVALHGARGHQTIENLNRDLQAKVEKISEQQRRIMVLQSELLRQAPADRAAEGEDGQATVRGRPVERPVATRPIVGSSQAVQDLLQVVRKVAQSPSAVLIRGESGTGKELLARAVHQQSQRAEKPFVKVHCAALSASLLESELFGHVKGAFTGAHKDKVGRFELAHGGTLFLDEIGDITLETQTKLLRVLQEKTFERVGSSEPISVDVRIVAATHQHLEELMRAGRFREDLFFRLNVITIRTPPLRERREDLYELALHFLKTYSQRSGKTILHVEDEALEAMKAYHWPGNIRELENVIERAVVLAEGQAITLREMPTEILAADHGFEREPVRAVTAPRSHALVPEADWSAQQERQERDRLLRAMQVAGGNKSQAARALGMPRSTLVSKLEKFGMVSRRKSVP